MKLGIQKRLWQPKLQTFFEIDFCFVSSKDQIKMCKFIISSFHAFAGKIIRILSKKAVFEPKAAKLHIQKQLWQPKGQTFYEMNFCFVSSKDQIKMCKITILSFHAFAGKIM